MKCIVCNEVIRDGARKCIHCGSYQDWRRYVHSNASILTFLISIISLLTSTYAIIKSIPHKPKGEATVIYWASTNPYDPKVYAMNSGDEPSIINSEGKFFVVSSGVTKSFDAITHPSPENQDNYNILMPGQAKIFTFQWNGVRIQDVMQTDAEYYLVVTVLSSNGDERKIELSPAKFE